MEPRADVPAEVRAWAEIEGATLIAPPLAEGNWLKGFMPSVTVGRTPAGEEVRRVGANGGTAVGCIVVAVVLIGAGAAAGMMMGVPWFFVGIAGLVLAGIAAVVARTAWLEVGAGPLIEVEAGALRVPRTGAALGRPEQLGGVLVSVTHGVRYDDGVQTSRHTLPAVWHEAGGRATIIVLPARVPGGTARKVVTRLLEGWATRPVREIKVSTEERRKGRMPTGD